MKAAADLPKAIARLVVDLAKAAVLLAAFMSAVVAIAANFGWANALLDILSQFALLGFAVSLVAFLVALAVRRHDRRAGDSLRR